MNSLQIALCDDNSLSLQLAQLAIQEYERQHPDRICRLHCFSSGTALLSFLDEHKDFCSDLFILDIMMPTLNGIQTGMELRARGDNGRIVYLSASPDFAISAYDVHAYSYLLKPIDRKKLFEILDNTHLSPRKPQGHVFPIHVGPSVRMVSFDELVSAEPNGRTILYTLEDGSVIQTPTIPTPSKQRSPLCSPTSNLCSAAYLRSSTCATRAVLRRTACSCSTDGRFPSPVRPAQASKKNGRNTGAARLRRTEISDFLPQTKKHRRISISAVFCGVFLYAPDIVILICSKRSVFRHINSIPLHFSTNSVCDTGFSFDFFAYAARISMCMGFGCNACGVTGCRIIDSPRERLIAILTNSFAPCNGRFPLLIFLCAVFFGAGSIGGALLLTGVIAGSVLLTLAASRLLSAVFLRGVPSSFVLELPPYRAPQPGKVIVRSVLGRAAVVAAPAGALIWLLANITVGGSSLYSGITAFLDPFARFFGLDGVILAAFLLGFPANELVMPLIVLGYLSGGTLDGVSDLLSFRALLLANGWTACTALCTLLFTLCHWPCSTTCLTIFKETRSVRCTLAAIALPTGFGLALCALTRFLFLLV